MNLPSHPISRLLAYLAISILCHTIFGKSLTSTDMRLRMLKKRDFLSTKKDILQSYHRQKRQLPLRSIPVTTPVLNDKVRRKRYTTVVSKWTKLRITYSINNFTTKIGKDGTHQAIDNAFNVWAKHSPLNFVKVNKDDNPDIVILFASGSHGDRNDFDGKGVTKTHAFYPGPGIGGDIHFDSEEPWTINKAPYEGIDLFLVAVHEIGHALGLGHSSDINAIMVPVYQYHDTSNFQLPQDDINGIQFLYGKPSLSPSSTAKELESVITTPTSIITTERAKRIPSSTRKLSTQSAPFPSDICDIKKFDAISFIENDLYVFSSKYMWRKSLTEQKAMGPVSIASLWPAVKSGVSAVFENPSDHTIVVIKGKKYYEYDVLAPRFSRRLKRMGVFENDIDAAIWWYRIHDPYLFKGDKYWRLENDRVAAGYPKNISVWEGVPADLDAAFVGPEEGGVNHTYFVKGNKYWKFHNLKVEVIDEFDNFAHDWLGCGNVLVQPSPPSTEMSIALPSIAMHFLGALGVY
uniref:matrix metalloproteinase-24-like n=1 Tax=Styela clava TaxID=7725 RepID=UPI00193A01B5|nr:matrix metalloproteinase-24-like [Styela clava]